MFSKKSNNSKEKKAPRKRREEEEEEIERRWGIKINTEIEELQYLILPVYIRPS